MPRTEPGSAGFCEHVPNSLTLEGKKKGNDNQRGVMRIKKSKSMGAQEALAHKEVSLWAEVPGNNELVGYMPT